MKIFVTGGTGFIGSQVVKKLAARGHALCCLARPSANTTRLERLGASVVRGDLADLDALKKGMAGRDQVVHLAATYSFWLPDRRTYRSVNVDGTRNVMECALEAGVAKVVHVSSVVVYGKPADRPFSEESLPGRECFSEYAKTKREGDQIAWDLAKSRGLPLVVVYPGGVLGPRDPKASGEYIRNFMQGKYPGTVYDHTAFPWVHVADVAEAIARAVEKPGNAGQKYFVVSQNATFEEINRMIGEAAGISIPRLHLPDAIVMMTAAFLTGVANVRHRPPLWGLALDEARTMKEGGEADGSKAERELGITYTPICTAIQEAVESLMV